MIWMLSEEEAMVRPVLLVGLFAIEELPLCICSISVHLHYVSSLLSFLVVSLSCSIISSLLHLLLDLLNHFNSLVL